MLLDVTLGSIINYFQHSGVHMVLEYSNEFMLVEKQLGTALLIY